MQNNDLIKKVFSYVFIIGLSLIFIFAFSTTGGSLSGGGNNAVVGEVNGHPVRMTHTSQFTRTYRGMVDNLRRQGIEVSSDLEGLIRNQAFNQVAQQRVVNDFADENHIKVDDQALVNFIRTRYFVNPQTGGFETEKLKQYQENSSLLEKQQVEDDALAELKIYLTTSTLFSHFPVSSYEVLDRLSVEKYAKKAKIAYITMDDKIENYVDDQSLQDYFRQNKASYTGNFEENKDDVFTEYVNNNSQILIDRVSRDLRAKMNQARESFARDFTGTARSLGMVIANTQEFNYYSEELTDSSGEVIRELPSSILKQLIPIKKGKLSEPFTGDNVVGIALITDETSTQLSASDTSSFTLDRYMDELIEKKRGELMNAFQQNLLKRASIENKLTP